MPFLVVIGLLDVLAALEPDLSVSMLYTLLMALLLFVGGARMSHFVALGVLAIPVLWHKIERLQYALLRVSTFLESMHRNFETPSAPRNVVVVTHGLTMRLFCMRWFHWSVEYFESLENPGNAEAVVLERQPDFRYKLQRPFRQWDPSVNPTERERSSWL